LIDLFIYLFIRCKLAQPHSNAKDFTIAKSQQNGVVIILM